MLATVEENGKIDEIPHCTEDFFLSINYFNGLDYKAIEVPYGVVRREWGGKMRDSLAWSGSHVCLQLE